MPAIIFNSSSSQASSDSQIENFQTTLASLNQQVISLRETLKERDEELIALQSRVESSQNRTDETLTIVGALIKLYRFVFSPGKAE